MGATFPLQHRVEPFFQGMQVQNVACGVGYLRLGQGRTAPVGGLLLLRYVDIEQFSAQIL